MNTSGNSPKILAISGLKNSGKTTLIERLIPAFASRGIKTAVIKHDGHSFSPDTPGTDSFRFFQAGATGSAVFDGEKFSLSVRRTVSETEFISMFPECGLIILEGFKSSPYPKLELMRNGSSPVCDKSTCIAYVSDTPVSAGIPVFKFDDIDNICDFVISRLSLSSGS